MFYNFRKDLHVPLPAILFIEDAVVGISYGRASETVRRVYAAVGVQDVMREPAHHAPQRTSSIGTTQELITKF